VLQQSGEITDFPGSSVSFEGNGGAYQELNFQGVEGYWLGAFSSGGVTQSVTISFGQKLPSRAQVRVAALNDGITGQEKFNYSFSGASSVEFAILSGSGFVDDGSTVTPGSGTFRLTAEGDITEIFVEGEMINGGSNGVIVEVCLTYV
jgi:hypothetical protein